jgi:hypothetical protein
MWRGDQSLSTDHLGGAFAIIHRVGSGNWDRPVTVTQGSAKERQFAQREWRALFHGLLLDAEHRYPHLLWINRPSSSLLASNKYHLMASAQAFGLEIPATSISNTGRLPSTHTGQYVAKAINEDEEIDHRRTFSTSRVPDNLIAQSPYLTRTPALIQELIEPRDELRVYYLLDEVFAITLSSRMGSYQDIRQVPAGMLSVDRTAVDRGLHQALRAYCHHHALSYCVFDFLTTPTGNHMLIDVTPSGTWSYYEPSSDQFLTHWYVQTLARALSNEYGPSD